MVKVNWCIVLAIFLVPWLVGCSDGDAEIKGGLAALRNGQEVMQADLLALKTEVAVLKERIPEPRKPRRPVEDVSITIKIDGAPTRGSAEARWVLVEYTDYQCPFCARHARQGVQKLLVDYVAGGKLRYILKDFPLTAIHPQAAKAAEAAHCAGAQQKYWVYHDRLFENQRTLAPAQLLEHAGALGLDLVVFKACLDGGDFAYRVRAGLAEGQKAGVVGTPTMLLGRLSEDGGSVRAVKRLRGALPFEIIKAILDEALGEVG